MPTINLIHEKILKIIKQNYQKLDNLLCSSHTIPIPVQIILLQNFKIFIIIFFYLFLSIYKHVFYFEF